MPTAICERGLQKGVVAIRPSPVTSGGPWINMDLRVHNKNAYQRSKTGECPRHVTSQPPITGRENAPFLFSINTVILPIIVGL